MKTNFFFKKKVDIRVGGKFRIRKKIGDGAFNEIYQGSDIFDNSEIAIKLEHNSIKYPQLLFESRLLESIPGIGIPKVYWAGVSGEYNVMVFELLGKNLEELFQNCDKKFSLKTMLMIAIQVLDRIRHLHMHNYIHRDIKPQNFSIGRGENEHIIYLIDFGLAKRYREEYTNFHIPLRQNIKLTGTIRYASCNALNKKELSRRDDMESIGYMLIYLLKGSLPWQGLKIKQKSEKYSKIKELKMSLEPEKLCEDLPDEFKQYIESVKNLEFEEEPDYGRYINMFTELFKKKEYVKDYMYDWVEETKKNITKNFKETSMFNDISKITENEISANNNKNIGITTSNMNDRTKKDNEETEKENDETKDGKTEETNKKKDNCIIY
jgi:serine/threonine protein kinase